MLIAVKDWYRQHLVDKSIQWCYCQGQVIYRKGVGNIDGEGGWEHTMSEDVGSWWEVHSHVVDFGNVWGLLEVVGLLGMHVQNAQLGDSTNKSANHQWFESSSSFQEE